MSDRNDDVDTTSDPDPAPDCAAGPRRDAMPARRYRAFVRRVLRRARALPRRWLPFCLVAAVLGFALIPGMLSDVERAGITRALLPVLVITWALGTLGER
jgi:hypothetical protein